MKKFLVSLVLTALIVPLAQASFSDVAETDQYYPAITYLKENGIINGYEDGTFLPDNDVNRAEALKIILLGLGLEVEDRTSYELPFSDLANDAWYLKYVAAAYDYGIISGYDDGTFRPDATVNLAEAIKILTSTYDEDASETDIDADPYEDVPGYDWYSPFVQYAKNLNIIEPEDDGLLYPNQAVSRAKLSEMVYRIMYIEEHHMSAFDISLNWRAYQNELGYEVNYPYDWQVLTISDGGVVLWNRDEENNQAGFDRQYPNSASVSVFVHQNEDGLDAGSFFTHVMSIADYGDDVEYNELTVNGLYAFQVYYDDDVEPVMDMYVYLPNDTILAMYGSYGNGALSEHSHEEIYSIQTSALYVADAVTTTTEWEEYLEEARTYIQVDGMGTYVLGLFDDKTLIETDAIGVGTGPVDYYYSPGADATLKYERSFDVILDVQEGEGSDF